MRLPSLVLHGLVTQTPSNLPLPYTADLEGGTRAYDWTMALLPGSLHMPVATSPSLTQRKECADSDGVLKKWEMVVPADFGRQPGSS